MQKKLTSVENTGVWCYSRVSSKEQYQNNSSIQRQIEANEVFAKANNYVITAKFGGTYESAKSDFTRKEFMNLIEKVKRSKHKPFAIIVYKMSRFSRSGGNAIGLVNHCVEDLGVHLIESSSGISTTTERGKAAVYESLFHAFKENLERKEIIIPNMQAYIKKGYRFGQCPLGYDHFGPRVKNDKFYSREQKLNINSDGKLLKEAWSWKLTGGISDAQILRKLSSRGLKISKQKLSKIWRNPFYCGILINSLSDIPITGKWPPLISHRHFMKIQEILECNPAGYQHNKQEELRPLNRSLKCSKCENYMVGYEVKKKRIHYYRCLKCVGVSISANGQSKSRKKNAEQLLADLFQKFEIPVSYSSLIELQLTKLFIHFDNPSKEKETALSDKLLALQKNLKNLKIRRGLDQIDQETFDLTQEYLHGEIAQINKEIESEIPKISNLEKLLAESLKKLTKLNVVWSSANLEDKRIFQKILFPNGILFDAEKHEYLTSNPNKFIQLIDSLSTEYASNKNATFPIFQEKSRSVSGSRLELPTFGL
ncbi:recombinase family protein [soil metagenome]